MKNTKIEEIEIGKDEAEFSYDAADLATSRFIETYPGRFTQVNAQVIGDREDSWIVQVMGSKGHESVLGEKQDGLSPGSPRLQYEEHDHECPECGHQWKEGE